MRNLVLVILGFLLPSCDKTNEPLQDIEPELSNPELKDFRFLSKTNNIVLVSDITCNVLGDSVIDCHIPHIVENKFLVPTFNANYGELYLDGDRVVSGATKIDCSRPVKLELRYNSKSSVYTLRVKCFTGLPVVYINTENNAAITSKDNYLKGTIKIVEDIVTRGPGDVFESEMKIKGRGNSTWTLPKKPYKIKFDH